MKSCLIMNLAQVLYCSIAHSIFAPSVGMAKKKKKQQQNTMPDGHIKFANVSWNGHFPDAPSTTNSGVPLADDIATWFAAVWPKMRIRSKNMLWLAISNLEKGYEVKCSLDGSPVWEDAQEDRIPAGYEILFHGCNPYPDALRSILQEGLKRSGGKGNYVGVFCSENKHTAFQYPMELKETGVQISQQAHAPAIRVVLEVVAETSLRIKRFKGETNMKTGKITNQQSVYHPQDLRIRYVHIICTQPAVCPCTDASQMKSPRTSTRKVYRDLRKVGGLLKPHRVQDLDDNHSLQFKAPQQQQAPDAETTSWRRRPNRERQKRRREQRKLEGVKKKRKPQKPKNREGIAA